MVVKCRRVKIIDLNTNSELHESPTIDCDHRVQDFRGWTPYFQGQLEPLKVNLRDSF